MKLLSVNAPFERFAPALGATESLIYNNGYKPNIICTTSAAAFFMLPLVIGRRRQLVDLSINLAPDDWYDFTPFNNKGGLKKRSLWRLFWGRKSLTTNRVVSKYVDNLVGREGFDFYKSPDFPSIIVTLTKAETGATRHFDLKKVTYNEYRDIVMASCARPQLTKPVVVNNENMIDGMVGFNSSVTFMYRQLPIVESVEINCFENRGQKIPGDTYRGIMERQQHHMFFGAQWIRLDQILLKADENRVMHSNFIIPQEDLGYKDYEPKKLMNQYRMGVDYINEEYQVLEQSKLLEE